MCDDGDDSASDDDDDDDDEDSDDDYFISHFVIGDLVYLPTCNYLVNMPSTVFVAILLFCFRDAS